MPVATILPGMELDMAVAEWVMGYLRCEIGGRQFIVKDEPCLAGAALLYSHAQHEYGGPKWSTVPALMLPIIERMRFAGWERVEMIFGGAGWTVLFYSGPRGRLPVGTGRATTLQEAVCRAALAAVGSA